jgi:hypothetical protein
MATADDVDTVSAVRKFLERQVVTDREDPTADTAEEITAVLEAIATTFLLNPQAALAFVMLAKNNFQQILQKDIELLDYLLKTVNDVLNPNELIDDTSDLVEAQTALVEVDRIGRVAADVKAYDRYAAAVTRFLDRRLARTLKRRRRREFERSGTEAKRDLFQALAAQTGVHGVVAARLDILDGAVADFQSVDLTKIVAGRTVTRVRNSLKKVLSGIAKKTLSKTAAAVELLAGAAALKSISRIKEVYDPIVETNRFPADRDIYARSQPIAAKLVSTADVLDLSEIPPDEWVLFWTFLEGDAGGSSTFAGEGQPFLLSRPNDLIDTAGQHLYIQFEGTPPTDPPTDQVYLVKSVELPTDTDQGPDELATLLDTELAPDATARSLPDGRILIIAADGVTRMVIRSENPGIFDIDGVYVPNPPSGHALLGFEDGQESERYILSAESAAALINESLAVTEAVASVEDGKLVVTSASTDIYSFVQYSGPVAEALGLGQAAAEPAYLELIEDGIAVDPASLGIISGAVVSVPDEVDGDGFISEPVASTDGTKIYFEDEVVPRCFNREVTVASPLLAASQNLTRAVRSYADVSIYAEDVRDLQRALTPLLSRPTLAQINDAKKILNAVRDRLVTMRDIVADIVVSRERNEFAGLVDNILLSLEERGLDRASDLLRQGAFSSFFSLSNTEASKSSRFLKSIEEVGRKDFPVTAVEEDQRDVRPVATTPDDSILFGEELSQRDEDFR